MIGFGSHGLLRGRAVAVLGCLLALEPAWAAEPKPSASAREMLTTRQPAFARTSPERESMLADSKARADFCVRCHGEDGNSKEPLVPNLAGQNPYYLLEQIERFADGRRKDFIMSPLARQFSRDDKVMVSLFYASMTARPQPGDPAQVAEGAALYGQRCIACHGQGARGSNQYARLAGQHPAYLKRRLAAFQQMSESLPSPMPGIARGLGDKEIELLSTYLASLP